MGDRDQKLVMLLDTVGEGVDVDFAVQVLEANNWDLQTSITIILGDGAGGAGGAVSASNAAVSRPQDGDLRAPMRTGYMDRLVGMDPAEQRRQEQAEAAEQARLEEERRKAEEEVRKQNLQSSAQQQRKEAERLAFERKKQRQQEEKQRLLAAHAKDTFLAAQEAAAPSSSGPDQSRSAEQRDQPMQSEQPGQPEPLQQQQQPPQRPDAVQEQPQPGQHRQEEVQVQPPEQAEVSAVVQALVALRKRYREAEPAALATCLKTMSAYLSNLTSNPHEPKYQRINCENSAFKTRVANLEGAIEVLEATGFKHEEGVLVVSADFARTNQRRLWDVRAKVDLMVEQLKNAGF